MSRREFRGIHVVRSHTPTRVMSAEQIQVELNLLRVREIENGFLDSGEQARVIELIKEANIRNGSLER